MAESKRARRLNVRLSEELATRLESLSEKIGIPASTLAAVAIGEYVNNKESIEVNMQRSSLFASKQISSAFVELASDPDRLERFASGIHVQLGSGEDQMQIAFDEVKK